MGYFDEVIDQNWLDVRSPIVPDPSWIGPPHDCVPSCVAIQSEVVEGQNIALWISGAAVYPAGLWFELHVRWRRHRNVEMPLIPGLRGRNGLCLGAIVDDHQRIIATGRRPAAAGVDPGRTIAASPLVARPHIAVCGLWVWPTPKVSLTWVVEWRAQRLREVRIATGLDQINVAASQPRQLWPNT